MKMPCMAEHTCDSHIRTRESDRQARVVDGHGAGGRGKRTCAGDARRFSGACDRLRQFHFEVLIISFGVLAPVLLPSLSCGGDDLKRRKSEIQSTHVEESTNLVGMSLLHCVPKSALFRIHGAASSAGLLHDSNVSPWGCGSEESRADLIEVLIPSDHLSTDVA